VKRLIPVAAISAAALMQGCATSAPSDAEMGSTAPGIRSLTSSTNEVSPIALSQSGQVAVNGDEIGVGRQVPIVEGHPLTSVVVTQCNMVVAVYMTMPDGRLLRFDKKTNTPAEQLVSLAYTATRSERVEVSCEGTGAVGYETHGPT
jgi:hypothetical protein